MKLLELALSAAVTMACGKAWLTHVLPPSLVLNMAKQVPDEHLAAPKAQPTSEEIKLTDSGEKLVAALAGRAALAALTALAVLAVAAEAGAIPPRAMARATAAGTANFVGRRKERRRTAAKAPGC
jgi:hypothetical protein